MIVVHSVIVIICVRIVSRAVPVSVQLFRGVIGERILRINHAVTVCVNGPGFVRIILRVIGHGVRLKFPHIGISVRVFVLICIIDRSIQLIPVFPGIRHSVIVIIRIRIADISDSVIVRIRLVSVSGKGTVVIAISDSVAVAVRERGVTAILIFLNVGESVRVLVSRGIITERIQLVVHFPPVIHSIAVGVRVFRIRSKFVFLKLDQPVFVRIGRIFLGNNQVAQHPDFQCSYRIRMVHRTGGDGDGVLNVFFQRQRDRQKEFLCLQRGQRHGRSQCSQCPALGICFCEGITVINGTVIDNGEFDVDCFAGLCIHLFGSGHNDLIANFPFLKFYLSASFDQTGIDQLIDIGDFAVIGDDLVRVDRDVSIGLDCVCRESAHVKRTSRAKLD